MLSILAWLISTGLFVQVDAIDAALRRPELLGADVAVAVVEVETGKRVYARNLDLPLAPASNMKLLTTAAALGMLGPDHHLSTRLLSDAPPDESGVLHGDLVVEGGGDPCLRTDLLGLEDVGDPAALLAAIATSAGLSGVEGGLVLDDGLLDRQWLHPDWPAGDVEMSYAAPIGALSMHTNCLSIEVGGAGRPSAKLLTATPDYHLRNELRAATKPATCQVGALRPDGHGLVRVRGSIGRGVTNRPLEVPVHDPADLFGGCLREALGRSGVTFSGDTETRAGAAAAIEEPYVLGSLETPLGNAVLLANKESDNSIADHLFKLLGAKVVGEGSFSGGGRAIGRFLREKVRTDTDSLMLRDGSGLSPHNRVTARAMVDMLVAMANADPAVRDPFLHTLPVSGLDGSLAARLTDQPYQGAVRAKTGYISRVSCLSGYARSRTGRTYAFSILINGYGAKHNNTQMKAIQDSICRALVDHE
jgi:D-alanyl-D-alanine carboxypeptidase/D-alanyl-D-alanine-endopeptidase (penicillin-binding protein 4)